ncbi:MAG: hypothetical protein ABUL64_01530, partial [Singulisphaera sp.]
MNIEDPISPDQVEDLVRLYLESTGPDASVDRCRAMIAAHVASEAALEPADLSTARIPTARIVKMPARRTWSALGKYALAASLLIALAVGGYFALAPEAVSAYALVSAATTTLDHPADRCYRVESLIPKAWRKRNPLLDCGDETYLWTRGDRYRFLTLDDGRQRLWGQDAERRLWIVD